MRVFQLAATALMAMQVNAFYDDPTPTPTRTVGMKRSETNKQTTKCTGSCVTALYQDNADDDPSNVNEQDTYCEGSCTLYVVKDKENKDEQTKFVEHCKGSCAIFTIAPLARRYSPGSYERRNWDIVAPPTAS